MNAEQEAIMKIVEEKWAIEAESNVFSDPESTMKRKCVECLCRLTKINRNSRFGGHNTTLCDYCEWLVYEGPNGVKI